MQSKWLLEELAVVGIRIQMMEESLEEHPQYLEFRPMAAVVHQTDKPVHMAPT
jgi:hypothetical protein